MVSVKMGSQVCSVAAVGDGNFANLASDLSFIGYASLFASEMEMSPDLALSFSISHDRRRLSVSILLCACVKLFFVRLGMKTATDSVVKTVHLRDKSSHALRKNYRKF